MLIFNNPTEVQNHNKKWGDWYHYYYHFLIIFIIFEQNLKTMSNLHKHTYNWMTGDCVW